MNRLLALPLVVVCALMTSTGNAQDIMPPHVMQQLGLTQAWLRPVNVPVGAQSIADQQLFVHEANPREFVEIVVAPPATAAAKPAASAPEKGAPESSEAAAAPEGEVLMRIPTDQVGAGGFPIGLKEAQRLAKNQLRRLKRRGIEATLHVNKVPRVHLYTVGTDGSLECRDAESGEPIWVVGVGDQRLPYRAIGTNEEFLTVINGANLIKVEASTGEVMEEVRMSGAPMFGAINSGEFAMIPIIGGGVEGYPLYDPTRDPFMEIVAGSALAMPTKAPGTTRIAWGTDRGFVYVMEMQGTPSVLFRLNTDGIVSGRIASASGDRFFFGSEAGQVYGLRATRSGTVLWSRPIGEPFYNEPMVIGDQLLIRSTYGNLYSLNVDDGSQDWQQSIPNISELVAAFDGRVYATTLSGSLAVIEVETGKPVGIFNDVRPANLLVNKLTNRLYLVSDSGDVQCLRAENAVLPTFNVQPEMETVDVAAESKPKKDAGATPFNPGAADPFGAGGGADPFGAGGGADPFGGGGGADPFGGGAGGADPFGGGGDAPMDDPFGGNPFGS